MAATSSDISHLADRWVMIVHYLTAGDFPSAVAEAHKLRSTSTPQEREEIIEAVRKRAELYGQQGHKGYAELIAELTSA